MIDVQKILYSKTNSFSKFIIDYLESKDNNSSEYTSLPNIEDFEKQISEKKNHSINRNLLVDILLKQNKGITLSKKSNSNIQSLRLKNTFSVTTGHQLSLFTGPLYVIYKIISTINLCDQLNNKYSENKFVPIYWMATEDHDFNEINHINLFGEKIEWNSNQSGAVGKMQLDDFNKVILELKKALGSNTNSDKLIEIFESSYLRSKNLADATRTLFQEIFGKYGLVIIDGDCKDLKRIFIPFIKKDILYNGFVDAIKKSSSIFSKDYKQQVFVRDSNFFKLSKSKRELITEEISELEIDDFPYTFSPNVLLRPLYQEVVLPNIAYVGGGAELSYWMQLKLAFKQEKIPFPALVLRNSALILSQKQSLKILKLGFKFSDIFLPLDDLKKQYVFSVSEKVISLDKEIEDISLIYKRIESKTDDQSMQNSIQAMLQKQLSLIKSLQQKLIRLEKKNHETSINQITNIKNSLFPNNNLQERYNNLSEYYFKYGDNFIESIKSNFDPLNPNFVILTFKK